MLIAGLGGKVNCLMFLCSLPSFLLPFDHSAQHAFAVIPEAKQLVVWLHSLFPWWKCWTHVFLPSPNCWHDYTCVDTTVSGAAPCIWWNWFLWQLLGSLLWSQVPKTHWQFYLAHLPLAFLLASGFVGYQVKSRESSFPIIFLKSQLKMELCSVLLT